MTETIDAAEQFLAAARFGLDSGHARSFAENLFAATELTAKAMVLSFPFPEVLTSKKHELVASKLSQLARDPQNVDREFVALLNELTRMRSTARYLAGKVTWTVEEMKKKFGITRAVLDRVKSSSGPVAISVTRLVG